MPNSTQQERKKAQIQCFNQSDTLETDMRAYHEHAQDKAHKLSLINTSQTISLSFEQLIEALMEIPEDRRKQSWFRELATIYYNWGSHLDQQAWFHDYCFQAGDADAAQAAISSKTHAIDTMKKALESYNHEHNIRAADKTQDVIKQYQHERNVLQKKHAPPIDLTQETLAVKRKHESIESRLDAIVPSETLPTNWRIALSINTDSLFLLEQTPFGPASLSTASAMSSINTKSSQSSSRSSAYGTWKYGDADGHGYKGKTHRFFNSIHDNSDDGDCVDDNTTTASTIPSWGSSDTSET